MEKVTGDYNGVSNYASRDFEDFLEFCCKSFQKII